MDAFTIVCIASIVLLGLFSITMAFLLSDAKAEIRALKTDLQEARAEALEHKAKVKELSNRTQSQEILATLSDLNNGGAVLSIERIAPENVYFHNGGRS